MASQSEEHAVKLLPRFFQPELASLAVNLPPSCTFWSVVEDQIEASSQEEGREAESIQEVLEFASKFFSFSVVETIEKNLNLLSESSLGLSYTLRKGKGEVARCTLIDLECLPALQQFSGWVSLSSQEVFAGDAERQPSTPSRESRLPRGGGGAREVVSGQCGSSSNSRRAGGGQGSGTGGSGGGSGSTNLEAHHFSAMDDNTVIVHMPAFLTLPKSEFGRSHTLRARSGHFIHHEQVVQEVSNTSRHYDPFHSVRGRVYLYHGTCTSSLASFRADGILPPPSRSEFSINTAFYVTNSICQAFEHPMHKHVASQGSIDPVSVLVFEVDVAALHGNKIPSREMSAFKCMWFPANTPEASKSWSDFCAGNISRIPGKKARPHDYDVVIGPVCTGMEEGCYAKLHVEMPSLSPPWQPVTQVALCTERARAWLQRCFKRVYVERRG